MREEGREEGGERGEGNRGEGEVDREEEGGGEKESLTHELVSHWSAVCIGLTC